LATQPDLSPGILWPDRASSLTGADRRPSRFRSLRTPLLRLGADLPAQANATDRVPAALIGPPPTANHSDPWLRAPDWV